MLGVNSNPNWIAQMNSSPTAKKVHYKPQTISRRRSRSSRQKSRDLTARVCLPPPGALTIQLVPASDLHRLEEYRADEAKFWTAAGLLSGLSTGVLVNVATGSTMTPTAWLLCAVSLVGLIFCACGVRTTSIRIRQVKKSLNAVPGVNSRDDD